MKKPFLISAKMLFFAPIFFMLLFVIIFYLQKESHLEAYNLHISSVPSIQEYSMGTAMNVQDMITKYGALAGVGLGVVFFLFTLLAFLALTMIRVTKFRIGIPLALLIGLFPLTLLGHNMVYVSGRMTALSSGIIIFLGQTLWMAALIMSVILSLILLFAIFKKSNKKKIAQTSLVFMGAMLFSGCDFLNWILGEACSYMDDKSHCYQEQAVADSNPDKCKNIPPKEGFSNSNPPKDKCYLMIAKNTGDASVCENIEGGFGSYTREECIAAARANQAANAPEEEGCEEGQIWNAETESCVPDTTVDPECADPSFVSQCVGSHEVLKCNDGKKSVEYCEFGCFEAWCRTESGPTDKPVEEPAEDEQVPPEEDAETADQTDDQGEKDDDEEDEPVCDCAENEKCIGNTCVPAGCLEDGECEEGEKCMNNICVQNDIECVYKDDCKPDETCKDQKCVPAPKCDEEDRLCISEKILEYCADGKIVTKDCPYDCEDAECLTQKEKEKREKEKEEEAACKAGYQKCISEVTLEVCSDGEKTEQKCAHGCEKNKCLTEPKKNCTGLQWLNPFCDEVDEDIEDKLETDIKTIGDAGYEKYMDLLDDQIDNETDPAKLRGLEKYKEFLEKSGETLENVQTSIDTLKDLKRIFLDSYDPSMDIDKMPVDKILQKGVFDRIGESIFGGPETEAGKEMAEAEDSLAVYEKMLERQAEIDFLKKSRLDRLGNVVTENVKGKMVDEVKDKATDIAKGVAGNAMIAVTVVDYALTSFQDEAKKQMFVGLSRAYNRRRAELEKQYPDMANEEIHKLATTQVQDMPYQDAKGRTFIKYGNLIENKDCQDSSNPLCIDNRVFWTAMDKTYEHNHRKDLHDRWMDQFDRRLEKSKALEEE